MWLIMQTMQYLQLSVLYRIVAECRMETFGYIKNRHWPFFQVSLVNDKDTSHLAR